MGLFRTKLLLLLALSLPLSPVACSSPDDVGDRMNVPDRGDRNRNVDGGVSGDATTFDGSVDDEAQVDSATPAQQPTGLRIDPLEIEIRTRAGVEQTAELSALAQFPDGSEADVSTSSRWYSGAPDIASIDQDGTLIVSATHGGVFEVTIEHGVLTAAATVTVYVTDTIVADGLDATALSTLGAGDAGVPENAPEWAYPEDQTVYPAGIVPPVFQWRANGNTLFELVVQRGEHTRVTYVSRSDRFQPEPAHWMALTFPSELPLIMTLTGKSEESAGAPRNVAPLRQMTIADASLEGTVYYWQIETGDIMQIDHGADSAIPMFPDNAETGNCRGCHSITRDGGRIGFMYNGGGDPRAGLAWVTEPDPPIIENHTELQWDFLGFDPTGNRAAAVLFGDIFLADTTPGLAGGAVILDQLEHLNEGGVAITTPDWSPDGSMLTYVSRDPGGVDWSFTWGDIMSVTWDPMLETFGAPRTAITRGGSEDTDALSYPSWSPDSRWLAFGRGPDNRGTPPAELYLADPATGEQTRLMRGSPDGLDVFPNFSPFVEGGYYWLLFYSRRPYGVVTENKQLWVMAIDVDMESGVDGSHPAFWLPGQLTDHVNITGYWAPSGCTFEGQVCKIDADCCVGLTCIIPEGESDGSCQRLDCSIPGTPCAADDECCPGYDCRPSLTGLDVCQMTF